MSIVTDNNLTAAKTIADAAMMAQVALGDASAYIVKLEAERDDLKKQIAEKDDLIAKVREQLQQITSLVTLATAPPVVAAQPVPAAPAAIGMKP